VEGGRVTIDVVMLARLTDEYFARGWGRHRSDGGYVLEYRKQIARERGGAK